MGHILRYKNGITISNSLTSSTGLIFAKVARPSRQKRYICFSEMAVINAQERYWEGSVDAVDQGRYRHGGVPCLTIRVANIRKSQLCDSGFHLLLVRKELEEPQSMDSDSSFYSEWTEENTQDNSEPLNEIKREDDQGQRERTRDRARSYVYRIHELNFELNSQEGRTRGNDLPTPLLPLPWTIIHPIDEMSPLHG